MSKSLDAIGAPLLPKLRGYFAEFLSQCSLKRLRVFLPPTCVGLRYGRVCNSLRGFSWQHGINQFAAFRPPHRLSELAVFRICLKDPPTGLDPVFHHGNGLPFLRHPFARTLHPRYRNVDLFPITYSFRPRLRVRLTLGGLTSPQETLGLRRRRFSRLLSLLMPP